MNSAAQAYENARKSALSCVNRRKEERLDPDLPVLDTYLDHLQILRRRRLGVREIRLDAIAGTCHASRTEAFAFNFMPLLEENSEFAAKWMSLYSSCLAEGLRDPIRVYELFGRYFVEEGNKRVSVMKALDNPLISADIIELTVDANDLPDGELYLAYLNFRDLTGISDLLMSRRKNYRRLLRILDVSPEHPMEVNERDSLLSLYYAFETLFKKKITEPISATAGDAFLILLEVFGWDPDRIWTQSELDKEFDTIRPAILAYPHALKAALLTQSDISDRRPMLSFLREPVRAALISPGNPQTSTWAAAHEQAFQDMAAHLGDKVTIRIWNDADDPDEIEQALEEAVAWKADVVFTCHPLMLQATNQFAARYPNIKFLNCSLNPESTAVRSYYTRGYELQFLQGMAAGALSTTGKIGYIADYPIYGAIADINAFAIGAMMMRPDIRVYLDWSTTQSPTNQDFPLDIDMIYISGQDFDTRTKTRRRYGLFDVRTNSFARLSESIQKWDVFYTRIVSSIFNRTYRTDALNNSTTSINYWLGLSNGLMDVTFNDHLPAQTRRLIRQIKDDIADGRFFVFDGLKDKAHNHLPGHSLSMEDIARMDWFVSSIVGYLPDEDDLIPEAEKLVLVHGLEADDEDEDDKTEQTDKDMTQTDQTMPSAADQAGTLVENQTTPAQDGRS